MVFFSPKKKVMTVGWCIEFIIIYGCFTHINSYVERLWTRMVRISHISVDWMKK